MHDRIYSPYDLGLAEDFDAEIMTDSAGGWWTHEFAGGFLGGFWS